MSCSFFEIQILMSSISPKMRNIFLDKSQQSLLFFRKGFLSSPRALGGFMQIKKLTFLATLILAISILPNSASAKDFSNCSALLKVHKYGIARSQSIIKNSPSLKYKPKVNPKIYRENSKLDFDKDGIICEIEKVKNPNVSSEPKQTQESNILDWRLGDVVLDSQKLGFTPVDVEPVVINKKLRLYVEKFGTRGIVSFTSLDGINFTQDSGIRLDSGAFPSIVEIDDNKWRMYFAEGPEIKSALSTDGDVWIREEGKRATGREASVTRLKDGRYLMALRVDGSETPPATSCNKTVSHVNFMISNNGLEFNQIGRVVDSILSAELNGRAFGVEFARLSNGDLYLIYEGCGPIFFAQVNESTLAIDKGVVVPILRGKPVADHFGENVELGGAGGDHGFVIFEGIERLYFGLRSAGGSKERIGTATKN